MLILAAVFLKELWHPSASSSKDDDAKSYWSTYGGFKAIWESIYFWSAFALNLALRPIWCGGTWKDFALGILPNLLGFSIGAIAVTLAFPDKRVFAIVTDEGGSTSYYINNAARLVHFILLQILAIILAIFCKTYDARNLFMTILNFLGSLVFLYALVSGAAIAWSMFGLARVYNLAGGIAEEVEQPVRDGRTSRKKRDVRASTPPTR